MILGADNRKPYSDMDILVLWAYKRYKNELCPQHGGPIWLCRTHDLRVNVRVKTVDGCSAAIAVKEYEEKHKDDEDKQTAIPEFYMRDGEELPLRELRHSYFERLAKPEEDAE